MNTSTAQGLYWKNNLKEIWRSCCFIFHIPNQYEEAHHHNDEAALPECRKRDAVVGVKGWRVKLLIYQLIYVPKHTSGHEVCVVTGRMTSQMMWPWCEFVLSITANCLTYQSSPLCFITMTNAFRFSADVYSFHISLCSQEHLFFNPDQTHSPTGTADVFVTSSCWGHGVLESAQNIWRCIAVHQVLIKKKWTRIFLAQSLYNRRHIHTLPIVLDVVWCGRLVVGLYIHTVPLFPGEE